MKIAIVGSGPSCIYLLHHLSIVSNGKNIIDEIHIFDKEELMGMGLPYSPATTDKHNLANISSEEIPPLKTSFADWLLSQSEEVLEDLALHRDDINEKDVYSRIALGRYLNNQYVGIIKELKSRNIHVFQYPGLEVTDIKEDVESNCVHLFLKDGSTMYYDKVVILTGHILNQPDNPAAGLYKSPWPIEKILPQAGQFYNYTIGTLGASLSAFDVATALAHRHGRFVKSGKRLVYKKHPLAAGFKVAMHSAEGWLPNLQYEQKEPMRRIYRYTTKDELINLRDDDGFLRIDTYFNSICRPVLKDALLANGYTAIAEKLSDNSFSFEDLILELSERHEYDNPFAGMVEELAVARISVNQDKPIYWKEAVDDLIYTLNFHFELLPAEDRRFFKDKVMPFLMNVIAALPLQSAKILLAMHDAGSLELIKGEIQDLKELSDSVKVTLETDKAPVEIKYKMFIICGGDKKVNLETYPFKSLVEDHSIRAARAAFAKEPLEKSENVFEENGRFYQSLPGIDVDSAFRIIGADGMANTRIFDPTFTHNPAIRPYTIGLQACNATAEILTHFLRDSRVGDSRQPISIEQAMKIYDGI